MSGWDIGNVTDLSAMFKNDASFNQNIGSWDIGNVVYFDAMFEGATLSTDNYDSLLIGWSNNQVIPYEKTFDAGNSQYCAGAAARQELMTTHNWTITDGGSCSQSFITTWNVTSPGESITIPTTGDGYDYIAEWGDGDRDLDVTGDATHMYTDAGTYTVIIRGTFPRIYFANGGDKDKILSIENWGNIAWTSMANAFQGCTNLVINATDAPDLSNVTSLLGMFYGASSLNQNINSWDVSHVNSMYAMFSGASAFNQPLDLWDVSQVSAMSYMFSGASSFDQDISGWDVGNATTMENMFSYATAFDQNIGNWDVSNVLDMHDMFSGSGLSIQNYDLLLLGWAGLPSLQTNVLFDAGNSIYCIGGPARDSLMSIYNWTINDAGQSCTDAFITTWQTTAPNEQITITTAGGGYNYCVGWGDGQGSPNVSGNVSHTYTTSGPHTVTIEGVFPRIFFYSSGPMANKIISIDQWGTIAWTSMEGAFTNCHNLQCYATDAPDLSNVTSMFAMFFNCTSLNANLNNWDVSHVQDMTTMFSGATAFNGDITGWDVGNVNTMFQMFTDAVSFNQPIGNWNVFHVTTMQNMFWHAAAFNQDIGGWDVSNVSYMTRMFSGASSFNQDIGGWDVGSVLNMQEMFSGATSFNQDIGGWDVENVTNMNNMFSNVTLSTPMYDSLLIGWNRLPSLQTDVNFHGGFSKSCPGFLARANIAINYGWNFTDGGVDCPEEDYFITTWKTDNPGTSDDNQIIIPISNLYNSYYWMDFGDGFQGYNTQSTIYTYATPGTYTVKIYGLFPHIYFGSILDNEKILSVEQWGDNQWLSMYSSFFGCSNLVVNATDTPDLSHVTDMQSMFL